MGMCASSWGQSISLFCMEVAWVLWAWLSHELHLALLWQKFGLNGKQKAVLGFLDASQMGGRKEGREEQQSVEKVAAFFPYLLCLCSWIRGTENFCSTLPAQVIMCGQCLHNSSDAQNASATAGMVATICPACLDCVYLRALCTNWTTKLRQRSSRLLGCTAPGPPRIQVHD